MNPIAPEIKTNPIRFNILAADIRNAMANESHTLVYPSQYWADRPNQVFKNPLNADLNYYTNISLSFEDPTEPTQPVVNPNQQPLTTNGRYVVGNLDNNATDMEIEPQRALVQVKKSSELRDGEEQGDIYGYIYVNVPQNVELEQNKTVTITSNTTQTITPETGYGGFDKITITTNVPQNTVVNELGYVSYYQEGPQPLSSFSKLNALTEDSAAGDQEDLQHTGECKIRISGGSQNINKIAFYFKKESNSLYKVGVVAPVAHMSDDPEHFECDAYIDPGDLDYIYYKVVEMKEGGDLQLWINTIPFKRFVTFELEPFYTNLYILRDEWNGEATIEKDSYIIEYGLSQDTLINPLLNE